MLLCVHADCLHVHAYDRPDRTVREKSIERENVQPGKKMFRDERVHSETELQMSGPVQRGEGGGERETC